MKQKNHMRTPKEKAIIIKDYLSGTGIKKMKTSIMLEMQTFIDG